MQVCNRSSPKPLLTSLLPESVLLALFFGIVFHYVIFDLFLIIFFNCISFQFIFRNRLQTIHHKYKQHNQTSKHFGLVPTKIILESPMVSVSHTLTGFKKHPFDMFPFSHHFSLFELSLPILPSFNFFSSILSFFFLSLCLFPSQ